MEATVNTKADAAYKEEFGTNKRGESLFNVTYLPTSQDAHIHAAVVWAHGFAEHVGRYSRVFGDLASAGFAVFSYDMHGHGKSEPKQERYRAYVHRFQDLVDDYLLCVERARAHFKAAGQPVPPIIAAGHSLGGLLAATAAASSPAGTFQGLILHSAAIDLEWTPVLRMQEPFGNCLACCCPFAQIVPAVRPQDMSQDPQVVKEYMEDPLNYTDPAKARTGNEILKGFKAMKKLSKKLDLPIYAAHGTKDRCTSIKAVKNLLKAAPSSDKTFYEVEGGYHEVLMGPEAQACMTDMIKWLKRHSSPTAVAAVAAGSGQAAEAAEGAAATSPDGVELVAAK